MQSSREKQSLFERHMPCLWKSRGESPTQACKLCGAIDVPHENVVGFIYDAPPKQRRPLSRGFSSTIFLNASDMSGRTSVPAHRPSKQTAHLEVSSMCRKRMRFSIEVTNIPKFYIFKQTVLGRGFNILSTLGS